MLTRADMWHDAYISSMNNQHTNSVSAISQANNALDAFDKACPNVPTVYDGSVSFAIAAPSPKVKRRRKAAKEKARKK